MTPAAAHTWPRRPLSEADLAAIAGVTWRTFPVEVVVCVAEAWNAGKVTAEMAHDLGCKPGSLRVLIGKLVQIGVQMRRAAEAAKPGFPRGVARSPAAEAMAEEQLARLRRVASWDSAAAHALSLYERGRVARP